MGPLTRFAGSRRLAIADESPTVSLTRLMKARSQCHSVTPCEGLAWCLLLGISWTGTLKLDAESGPFHFSGTLSKDKWEITLSLPQDTYIPNLSTLGTVFTEGEKAIGKMADATRSFNNIGDAAKVGALIKPHVAAIEDAVDAVSGIAKAPRKGGASFGFKLGSPDPGPGQQGMPGGFQAMAVFTYVF